MEAVDGDHSLALGGGKSSSERCSPCCSHGRTRSSPPIASSTSSGRPPAQSCAQHDPVLRLAAAEDARRRSDRHPAAGLSDPRRARGARPPRFERLSQEGTIESLHAALELWHGRALSDLAYESFAQDKASRLEEPRLVVQERRIEADLEAGRAADLVSELEGLIADHPLRERLRGQLMLALYRSGRQADALAAYQAARSRLA